MADHSPGGRGGKANTAKEKHLRTLLGQAVDSARARAARGGKKPGSIWFSLYEPASINIMGGNLSISEC